MTWIVPYIDLPLQYKKLQQGLDKAFRRIMSNGDFILRKDIQRFEENMATFLNVKHVIGVGSGYDALYLALDAHHIGRGCEVITTSHTFIATISAIVHSDAQPIIVDIKYDYNIDVDKIEDEITNRTKAIVPVHMNGRSCEMKQIMKIADKHDLVVIEDTAQSIGAMYKWKNVGTFGTGCFSLHPMKILGGYGDGGFIATNDDNVARTVRMLRNHGRDDDGKFRMCGYNSRLDNLQAALLNVKFPFIERWILRRREIAKRYNRGLSGLPMMLPATPSYYSYDVFSSYVINVDRQQDLFSFLRDKKIEVFVHGSPFDHVCKHSCELSKGIISLPIYPEMTNQQVDYVIEKIRGFYEK